MYLCIFMFVIVSYKSKLRDHAISYIYALYFLYCNRKNRYIYAIHCTRNAIQEMLSSS